MASEISSVSIVYSTVCLGADRWLLWGEFTSLQWIDPQIRPVTRKMFPIDDVSWTSWPSNLRRSYALYWYLISWFSNVFIKMILLLPPSWRRLCFIIFYLRHGESFVFIVARWFVCLSVCMYISNITKRRLNGYSWNFQGMWDFILGTIGNIFTMFVSTPWTQDSFFYFFRRNPCLLAALQKNGQTWYKEQSGTFTGCSG